MKTPSNGNPQIVQQAFSNQQTFRAIRAHLDSLEDPVSEIELDDLVEWLTETDDLLQAVTELRERARFYAFARALSGPTLDSLLGEEED
jgi:hypothetical protein